MPELPEVETVKETLKKKLLNKKILNCNVYYEKMIENPNIDEFKKNIINQTINDIERRGKWLLFVLDNYYLLSHLRMEGKYFIKNIDYEVGKHDHVEFIFKDFKLMYNDTRKFGRMYLVEKNELNDVKPIKELGLEPWNDKLNEVYLKNKYKNKKLPIKTVLLDQSIIAGIGNIYADEILFLSKINPLTECNKLSKENLISIIKNTKTVLEKAIELGGTTIKSFTSSEGVHGRFQNNLLVHNQSICKVCNNNILKITIGGRGTYYCTKCQK